MSKYTQEQLRVMAQEVIKPSNRDKFASLCIRLSKATGISGIKIVQKVKELAQ